MVQRKEMSCKGHGGGLIAKVIAILHASQDPQPTHTLQCDFAAFDWFLGLLLAI